MNLKLQQIIYNKNKPPAARSFSEQKLSRTSSRDVLPTVLWLKWMWAAVRVRVFLPPRVTLPWRKRPWKMRRKIPGLLTCSSSHPDGERGKTVSVSCLFNSRKMQHKAENYRMTERKCGGNLFLWIFSSYFMKYNTVIEKYQPFNTISIHIDNCLFPIT